MENIRGSQSAPASAASTSSTRMSDSGAWIVCKPKGRSGFPYHLIAWRALGHQVPDFESGNDISHHCKKGQMRDAPPKGSRHPALKSATDASARLAWNNRHTRTTCLVELATPFTSDPHCQLFFLDCKHHPTCGTDPKLEEAMREQPSVTSITIEFRRWDHAQGDLCSK